MVGFFPKKVFMGQKHFVQKNYKEFILNVRTIDLIMAWWGRGFINDKRIFQ